MTIFGCTDCGCDCPLPCAFTAANCWSIAFEGFDSAVNPGFACTACGRIDEHTFILRRGTITTLQGRAVAIRPTLLLDSQEAVFAVTLARDPVTDAYSVSSISVVDGGSDYIPGTRIVFEYGVFFSENSFSGGLGQVRCDRDPFAFITAIGRDTPTVEAQAGCSVEAALTVVLADNTDENGEPVWEVESVTVDDPGSGCVDGSAVTFTTPNGVEVTPATAVVLTRREEPNLTVSIAGEPASGTVTYAESADDDGRPIYAVTAVSNLSAFPLPAVGDDITFTAEFNDVVQSPASAVVSAVDEFGNVTATVVLGGLAYNDTTEIDSIEVTDPGAFFRGGVIVSVALIKGGEIYHSEVGKTCFFSGVTCMSCPVDYGQQPSGLLTFATNDANQITATITIQFPGSGGTPTGTLIGTATAIEQDAESITFDTFTTQQVCPEVGSITVTVVDCDEEPTSPCAPMPQQIKLTIAGLAAGGILQGVSPETYAAHEAAANATCGTTGSASCFLATGGGFFGASISVGEDQQVILDLAVETCDMYIYSGQRLNGWSHSAEEGAGPICQTSSVAVIITKTPCSILVFASRVEGPSLENDLCPANDTCPRDDSGVASAVLAVGGTADGAVTSIVVETPGNCYAWQVFDYLEPEATVFAPTVLGDGAEFSLTFEEYEVGRWRVATITGSGGSGYIDGDAVELTLADGTCGHNFSGQLTTTRLEPEFTLELPASGSGDELTFLVVEDGEPCSEYWEFASLDIVEPGTGYKDRDLILVTIASGTIDQPAVLRLRVLRSEPVVTATVGDATLSVAMSETTDSNGDATFVVSSVSVVAAGSGIQQGSAVTFAITEGTITTAPAAFVNVLDGEVTSVVVTVAGELVDDIGPIDSIEIEEPGRYWTTDSSVGCVTVTSGGEFYKAVPSGVEVAEPLIRILTACGSGATAEAIVDADPDSETFGGIASITLTSGGTGYFPSGDAWFVQVDAGVAHLSESLNFLFGSYPENPNSFSFSGNDIGFVGHESFSNRTSTLCPNDLLNKAYRMWFINGQGAGGLTDANGNPCGKFLALLTTTFVRRFGGEDITCTIEPVIQ